MVQVRLAQWFEQSWGRLADQHLCVSKAMCAELKHGWHINAKVFYDRAPSHFGPTPLKEQVWEIKRESDVRFISASRCYMSVI